MNETWRIIIDTPRRGSLNMALDYVMLQSMSRRESPPTIRVYRWEKPAITIGYFQILHEEVYEDECRMEGIPVIRRISGGGAVLHEHEITYSITLPLRSKTSGGKMLDSFRDLCEPVIKALQKQSLQASYRPISDIVVGNRKVSGCAQARKQGALLQHGAILLELEEKKLLRFLKLDKDASPGIGCLKDFLGDLVRTDDFIDTLTRDMIASFQSAWGIGITYETFSESELQRAYQIEQELFANHEWNENRVSIA
jgi:lipoate---protein ligase